MIKKSDAVKGLRSFYNYCQQHRFDLQGLRLDNDKVFRSDEFLSYCHSHGVKTEFSAPHSPHQNGLIERTWRTLGESTFAMLEESGLNDEFWEYAFQTSVYIFNRTWKKAGNGIPYSKRFHKIPDLSHLRKFGCPVFSSSPSSTQ